MRILSMSLFASIITAIFGLGVFISWIYSSLAPNNEYSEEQKVYQNLSQQFSEIIQDNNDSDALLERWNQAGNINATFEDRDSLVLPQEFEKRFTQGETIALETDNGVIFYTLIQQNNKILVLIPPAFRLESWPYTKIVLTCVFYIGVVFAMSIWLLPLLVRLRLLDKTANDFGSGNFAARLPKSKVSYIKNIEAAFNAMGCRIQQLIYDNKLLSRAVSHDLKTPLARLRFGLETLEEETRLDKRAIYHKRINDDLDQMESLISTLLNYAKLDDAQINLDKKPINLADYVNKELANLPIDSHISISITEPVIDAANAVIRADNRYLSMIFHNLINNALNHAKQRIEISVTQFTSYVYLSVADDGNGVIDGDIVRIFKPFQKGTPPAHNAQISKGHGMGLAICARLAKWHDAEISVERSLQLGGAKFIVKFPLAKMPD